MKAGGKVDQVDWRCTYCGYVHSGEEAPEECPQCFAGKDEFVAEE